MFDSDLEDYIKKIIREFEQDSRNCRLDNVIDPPLLQWRDLNSRKTNGERKISFCQGYLSGVLQLTMEAFYVAQNIEVFSRSANELMYSLRTHVIGTHV